MIDTRPPAKEALGPGGRLTLALARLAIGLAQGVGIAALIVPPSAEWESAVASLGPALLAGAILSAHFLPLMLIDGLGKMRPGILAIWLSSAAAIQCLVGVRIAAGVDAAAPPGELVSFEWFALTGAAMFVAHQMVVATETSRKVVAPFSAYFEAAWSAAARGLLAAAALIALNVPLFFVSAFLAIFGALWPAAAVYFAWLSLVLAGLTVAAVLHFTEDAPLTRHARQLLLTIVTWLGLVAAAVGALYLLISLGALAAGVSNGGIARSALALSAWLIITISAAYGGGQIQPSAMIRWAVRIQVLILTLLVAVAAWAIGERIGQHGLTAPRLTAGVVTLLAAIHAVGYAFAAIRPGPWMRPVAATNLVAAVAALITFGAFATPLAPPTRIAIAEQVHRVTSGEVPPERFDFAYLRFEVGPAGPAALARLTRHPDRAIADQARLFLGLADLNPELDANIIPNIEPVFRGDSLPDDLVHVIGPDDPRYVCIGIGECLALTRDIDGDGRDEAVIATPEVILVMDRTQDGRWRDRGAYALPCEASLKDPRELLARDMLSVEAEASWPKLRTPEGRLRVPASSCPRPRADAPDASADTVTERP